MPVRPDPSLIRALGTDLATAGYTASAIRARWGPVADGALGRGRTLPALRALGGSDDPLAVLARLLGLGRPADSVAVDAALPALGVAGLVALGLADAEGGQVRPTALLRPQDYDGGEWWIASDLDEAALDGPLPEDHVLGVGGASLTLAGIQLTARVERALDVGTGCGIQTLRAGLVADSVVATDVSERALAFAALNVALNGLDGVELRRGDLFAPVAGETFDRIVSNPPFVITPRTEGVPAYEYRDGGRVGDGLVAEFVAGVGAHLRPGGTAQLLGNWETRDGVDGLERVRGWVASSDVPLDAWVIERERMDPVAYAELWIRDGGTVPGTPAFDALLDAWLDDFDARGVSEIGFGYVLLRRPVSGVPTLARYEAVSQPLAEGGVGAQLGAALEAHDRLDALDDDALAGTVLRVADDVTEARHHRPGDEAPTVIEIRQGGGLSRTFSVDPALAALVGASDGDLPTGVLIDAIADILEVDADALRADLLPRIRELVFTGVLGFASSR